MEANFRDVLQSIQQYKPVPWDRIPDLGLYMDQVITFITRMYEPLYGDQTVGYLSAPMINNYVKSKLIPRPVGKKYSREQIALLAMIVALKQVSSMEDIRVMLVPPEGMTVEQLYTQFCARQQEVVALLSDLGRDECSGLTPAMDAAIVSSGFRAGCEAMLKAMAH